MHIDKRIVAIFAALSTWLGLHPAMANNNPYCEYFEQSDVLRADTELSKLLKSLEAGSAVEICAFSKDPNGGADLVYIFSPIQRREQVSYFNLLMFQVPDGQTAVEANLIDLTSRRPIAKFRMMALDQDGPLTHKSKEFVETHKISIVQFKRLYTEWASILNSSNWDCFYDSRLDSDGKAAFANLLQSVSDRHEWKIISMNSSEAAFFSLSTRFVIEFSVRGEYWEIEFEKGRSKGFTLVRVSKAIS